MSKIIHSDCLDAMRNMEDNCIDFIVTDPPYGLNFMGKSWDKSIPNQDIWAEALRICKPGCMLAAFGGSRTHHHLMLAIETSGWEIRDVVMWIYGQGFPKSHNKFGFDGYGTALKPAYEPIIIAMKPLDGTFAQNAEKWGVGGINIDDSRIFTEDKLSFGSRELVDGIKYGKCTPTTEGIQHCNGRWPANLILDEESAEQLDQMTGNLAGAGNKIGSIRKQNASFVPNQSQTNFKYDNGGGASRFFYCAKASSSERNKGLDKNTHPTVKPISLMKYIITLLAPPGKPMCLDPFMGSGSTGVACKELDIDFIGIEKEQEYVEIAKKRINNVIS